MKLKTFVCMKNLLCHGTDFIRYGTNLVCSGQIHTGTCTSFIFAMINLHGFWREKVVHVSI